MTRRVLALLGLLLAVVLAAAACSAADQADTGGMDGREAEVGEEAAAFAPDAATGDAAAADAVGAPAATMTPTGDDRSTAGDGTTEIDTAPLLAPPTGDRIIKDGTVTVEVPADGFDAAFQALIVRAQQLGGDVTASTTQTDDAGLVRGTVTVRVPVRSYEDLLAGIADLGTVTDRSVSAQDVTAEFTDLESRRRHLQAQERFYLGLLDQAESVQDAIAVQQQLEGIQAQIEQITGRLNVLDSRTSFSTLTVNLREEGAETLATTQPQDAGSQLAGYWQTAREAFVNVIGSLLVVLLFALPFVAVGLIAWLLARPLLRRREPTRPAPPPPHRPPGEHQETRDPARTG